MTKLTISVAPTIMAILFGVQIFFSIFLSIVGIILIFCCLFNCQLHATSKKAEFRHNNRKRTFPENKFRTKTSASEQSCVALVKLYLP